jgi:tetratricopeptide (TPR) repeat protein
MNNSRGFLSILVPTATVFISSFCIMVLELVASRLIARYLGSSLYTWTAVIGVVLAGITIGNYLGGRIADRFQARKALAVLFAISSATCVTTVILNNVVSEWIWLWHFSWPARTFTHVSLVFLLPSVLLGTISPVVAKMALDRGLPTGRTVGDIYAWGAAGSIAGTFAAGYYLIATIGTTAIIWTVGGVLLLMAILYWVRYWLLYAWALMFTAALVMGTAGADWAKDKGVALCLRAKPNPKILYEDESQYFYIAVKQLAAEDDKRGFFQDKLVHSKIIMDDILDLQYTYEQIYAAATHKLSDGKKKLSTLSIGGGGYVYPRYIEKAWPGSRVDVVEIDPAVTEAAMQAFGLKRDTTIDTFTMDARNYVDELLEKKRCGGEIPRYDFIYEDAINDYSVPYQLTTKEFNDKIAQLLSNDGVYMVNILDIYDKALFLGAMVNTLEKTFPYVYVIAERQRPSSSRNTFVVAAAKQQIDLKNLSHYYKNEVLDLLIPSGDELEQLKEKAGYVVLTDDYAPVENLLAPVVRQSSIEQLAGRYLKDAEEMKRQGRWDEAIASNKKMMQADPTLSIKAYNDMALILAGQNKLEEAVEAFKKALAYNEQTGSKGNMANVHHSLHTALQRLGRVQEASDEFDKAVEEYHKRLIKTPNSLKTFVNLGDLLASNGRFAEAAEYFQKAVNLDPTILSNHFNLIQALELTGQFDAAIQATRKAIGFFSEYKQEQTVVALQERLELLEFKKPKHQKRLN